MNDRKHKLFATLLLACFIILLPTSCVEEFEAESITYEKLLVVDGNISDKPKAHEINLSFTSPINDDSEKEAFMATEATVWVEDNLGNKTYFVEQAPGNYISPINFAGVAERSYALFITTSEGKNYQSTYQQLVAAPEITSIYNRYKLERGDGEVTSIPGAQFFIDVEGAGQSTQFYRYEWTDTHQVIVPYTKSFDAERQPDGNYTITSFSEAIRECYRENRFNKLILATSSNNNNGELREVPIKFSDAADFQVTTQYSLEITQRALSADAYSYFRKIKEFNESNGSLFDKQQGVIAGNIVSLDSPEENVLGYFEVSGESSKRVFLSISDLDDQVVESIYRTCNEFGILEFEGNPRDFYDATDVDEETRSATAYLRSFYELFDLNVGLTGPVLIMAHRDCVDCRYNGVLNKPSYWP